MRLANTHICMYVCMLSLLSCWQWGYRTRFCDNFVAEGEGDGSTAGNTSGIDVTNGCRSISLLTYRFFYRLRLRLPKLVCFEHRQNHSLM